MKKIATLLSLFALSACTTIQATAPIAPEPVTVRVIGINDFHGNLEPLSRPFEVTGPNGARQQVKVAGAAALADAIARHRAENPYSLVISAGDLISASPLVSSLFLDEPSVSVMNEIGLDFNAVGNHEFDRGWRELKRMQTGGCEKNTLRDPCQVEQFEGAEFSFLAANVTFEANGETLFPASAIKSFGEGARQVNIGIIGLTLKETPTLVTPSGVDGLRISDEAEAINAQAEKLRSQGADAIIVAIHQGLYSDLPFDQNGCDGINGPLLDILPRLDPQISLVISGHTHQFYVCDYSTIDPQRNFLVTSAGYGGTFLTDIALTIDPVSGEVISSKGQNVLIRADGPRDPQVAAFVARYAQAASAAANRVVGRISGDGRDPGPATEETSLGNAIADAQLFATREAGAQIAFMNNSGIRTALVPREDGTITFGDIYAVQPFSNTLVTKTFSGSQLLALLEQQFDDEGFVQTFSPSYGFALSYDMRRPVGQRVVSATLDGAAIDPLAKYRVTMNSFLAAGGDSFTVFEQGEDSTVGPVDLDAMEMWLAADTGVRVLPDTGRITRLDEE